MERLKQELIELGTFAAERGWLPATSGNLSQRIDDYNFIITSSGCHKGKLTQDNFVIVDSRLDSVDWNKSCRALDERAGLDKTESNKNLCLKSLSEKLPDARHASPSERSLLDINEHREGEHNNADGTFRTGS